MGKVQSTPASPQEAHLLAEHERLLRGKKSEKETVRRLLGERDALLRERAQLEGRMQTLAANYESVARENKALVLEAKLLALYHRVAAGPHAESSVPDAVLKGVDGKRAKCGALRMPEL